MRRRILKTCKARPAGGGACRAGGGRRGPALLLALVISAVALLLTAGAMGANPSANLDQCANGPMSAPDTTPCQSGTEWVNGNLGGSKAHYLEGDSIPYRLTMSSLATGVGNPHTVTIEWDTSQQGKHALDYITSFNRTVTNANPCAGVSGCNPSSFSSFAIPKDPQVDNGSGSPVTQPAGNLRLYGGTITGVGSYSYPNGTGFAGNKSTRLAITFTASQANPVLAWGGHIAARIDWGSGNSAVAISGSPYHTRLIDLDGSGGNQDRSLSSDAVIFPASITISKDAVPNDPQDFNFSTTGGLSPASFSLDDDSDPTLSSTKGYSGLTNFATYSFTEAASSGWTLSFGNPPCTVTSPNGGTQSASGSTLSINLSEGENVSCTFTNTRQAAHLIVIKHVVNDNGGTKAAADFAMSVAGTAVPGGTTSFAGAESPGTDVALSPGNYSVSEAGVAGYTQTSAVGDCSGSIAAGQTKTCTITNDDQAAHLVVIKHVVNDNGGTKTAADFTMSVAGSSPSPASFAGAESPGTSVALNAGSYSVSESGPSGYSESDGASCTGSIAVGETKTCTITNDDQVAHLVVVKHVVNDNGGTKTAADFTMSVAGTAVPGGTTPFPGAEAPGTSVALNAGSYSVSESGPDGYASRFSADCAGSIAVGETKTCTVTNNDVQPRLIVIKHVVNDNGGSKTAADFTMSVTGSSPSPPSFPGAESPGTEVKLDAGDYSVSESGPLTSYTASLSADCSGSIAVGETKTCTITNTHTKAPTTTSTQQRLLPNDSISISGRAPVGGKARFELFVPADDTCAGTPAFSETVDVVDGKASTSNTDFVAVVPGTWRWKVSYLGDDENEASASACGVEHFTIQNSP